MPQSVQGWKIEDSPSEVSGWKIEDAPAPMAGPIAQSVLDKARANLRQQGVKDTADALRKQANPSLWERATTGMISPDFFARAMTGQTTGQLRDLAQPVEGEQGTQAEIPGSLGGLSSLATPAGARAAIPNTFADISNLASGFTSRVSLSMFGAGALGKLPGAVGTLARATGTAAGLGFGAQGAGEVITPQQEGETQADAMARRLGGASMAVSGLAGASQMGPEARAAASPTLRAKAAETMNSVIGETPAIAKTIRTINVNPGQAVLDEGIGAFTRLGLKRKVSAAATDYGQQIEKIVKDPPNTANSIELQPAVNAVFDKMTRAYSHDPVAVDRISQLRQGFLDRIANNSNPDGTISPSATWEMKHDLGKQINFRVEQDSMESLANEARSEVYSILRQGLDTAIPELAPINAKYAGLITADHLLDITLSKVDAGVPGKAGIVRAGTSLAKIQAARAANALAEQPPAAALQPSIEPSKLAEIRQRLAEEKERTMRANTEADTARFQQERAASEARVALAKQRLSELQGIAPLEMIPPDIRAQLEGSPRSSQFQKGQAQAETGTQLQRINQRVRGAVNADQPLETGIVTPEKIYEAAKQKFGDRGSSSYDPVAAGKINRMVDSAMKLSNWAERNRKLQAIVDLIARKEPGTPLGPK